MKTSFLALSTCAALALGSCQTHQAAVAFPTETLSASTTGEPIRATIHNPSSTNESARANDRALFDVTAVQGTEAQDGMRPDPAGLHRVGKDLWGPRSGDWEVAVGGAGNNDQEFDIGGFQVAGNVGYYLSDAFQVGVRQNFAYADAGPGTNRTAFTTRGYIDYVFPIGPLRPFIGVNAGFVYGNAVKETGTAAPEAGLKLYLQEKAFVQVMAEYQFFFEDSDGLDTGFDDGQFVYSLNMGLNF